MRTDGKDRPATISDQRATTTINSIFKEHRGYTDPRTEHKHIDKRQEAALSRYGRLGGIVSILPICLDMAGLAGLACST